MKICLKQAIVLGMTVGSVSLFAENGAGPIGPEATLGYMVNLGNDMKAMKDGAGYSIGLGYVFGVTDQFQVRPHLSAVVFEGVKDSGLTRKRPDFFAGLDIRHTITGAWSVGGGVFGMSWNQGTATAPMFTSRVNSVGTAVSSGMNGIRLGARAGLEYAVTKNISASAYFHVCEANMAYNPAWLTLGANVRF